MSCREHGFSWLSLSIRLYHPSHSAGPLDYIQCPYRAGIGRFLPDVEQLLVCVKESTEEFAYDLAFTPPAVSYMLCSSDLNSFRNWR